MKNQFSDDIYHTSHDLEKLFDAIEKKRKEYQIDREKLYWTIKEEEERDPSEKKKNDEGVFPKMKMEM